MRLNFKKTISLLTALCLLMAGLLIMASTQNGKAEENKEQSSIDVGEKTNERPTIHLYDRELGDKNAPHSIVMFYSYTCPHCANFFNDDFETLVKDYIDQGKVHFTFKEFAGDYVALYAAKVGLCLDETKGLDFMRLIFRTQQRWLEHKTPKDSLKRILKLAGFNEKTFEKCLLDKKMENDFLNYMYENAKKYKVPYVPAYYIDGKLHKGAFNKDVFKGILKK